MSNISALRSRVKRLLSSDFHPDDLTKLSLYIRDKSYGRETIREIGDFVAHADERTKGITTQSAKDFFTTARFLIPTFQNIPTDLANLPLNFPELLFANFRRLDDDIIKRETGLKRKAAEKMLKTINAKLSQTTTGYLSFNTHLEFSEISLIHCLTNYIISKPAFSEEKAFNEFYEVLIKNKLLDESDLTMFYQLKSAYSLFAICQMHQCKINLGDGTKADLAVVKDSGKGTIGVIASAEVFDINPTGTVKFAVPMFITSLNAESFCEQDLLNEDNWDYALEITSQRKLAKIR